MSTSLKYRSLFIAVIIIIAGLYITPSVITDLPAWLTKILPSKQIRYGLDLQGGMHLVLEVQSDVAVQSALGRTAQDIKEILKEDKIPYLAVKPIENKKIFIRLARSDDQKAFESILTEKLDIINIQKLAARGNGLEGWLELTHEEITRIKKSALEQSLEVIRNRVDEFGVSEPEIIPQGENRILVQLPGVNDPDRAKGLIGKTALLEFKLVDDTGDINSALKNGPPMGDEILYKEIRKDRSGKLISREPFLIKKHTMMTGEYITNALVRISHEDNTPYVVLKFDNRGAKLFKRLTGSHVRERLAIILDNKVHSAPVINEEIGGGEASITGRFTMDEASDLAIALRAGALPAPVKILEERTVGPSLGRDSIEKGFFSILIGGICVIMFMAFYYRIAGIIADIALVLNILLIMAGLALFGATLTLPGIAGIILTIGMAVDANVIIFERIREEVRLGKTPINATDAGFSKAFLTIVDANVTTLIVALVLFEFGTGPVKGFAVTLSIGIIASMFTAIMVSRVIFDYYFRICKPKELII